MRNGMNRMLTVVTLRWMLLLENDKTHWTTEDLAMYHIISLINRLYFMFFHKIRTTQVNHLLILD